MGMKAKIEKDKSGINHEIQDVRTATDEIVRSKASAEKSNKNLISSLNDVNKKVEEANLTLGDFENNKRKVAAENADLLRQLQELENNASLLGKFKNVEHELDGIKEQLEEETGGKDDVLRQVAKAVQEADMWRAKYEQEGLAKAEDLEMAKVKLQSRLSEAQGTIEQLNAKFGQLDKAKTKIQGDIDEMAAQADQAHILNSSMEKKAKQFDRVVTEWKQKVDSMSM